jgi:hypothetical protein
MASLILVGRVIARLRPARGVANPRCQSFGTNERCTRGPALPCAAARSPAQPSGAASSPGSVNAVAPVAARFIAIASR